MHDLCELLGVPLDEVAYRAAGVNHQAWLLRWEHEGESLYPLLDERIAADPELRRRVRVDMYRRLGYFPTETSEHSSEYVPWYLHHDERDRAAAHPGRRLPADQRGEPRRVRRDPRAAARRRAARPQRDATEYAPQVIHSMVTGTPRGIHANVANHGLITNLPDRATASRCRPCVDAAGVQPIARRRPAGRSAPRSTAAS